MGVMLLYLHKYTCQGTTEKQLDISAVHYSSQYLLHAFWSLDYEPHICKYTVNCIYILLTILLVCCPRVSRKTQTGREEGQERERERERHREMERGNLAVYAALMTNLTHDHWASGWSCGPSCYRNFCALPNTSLTHKQINRWKGNWHMDWSGCFDQSLYQ